MKAIKIKVNGCEIEGNAKEIANVIKNMGSEDDNNMNSNGNNNNNDIFVGTIGKKTYIPRKKAKMKAGRKAKKSYPSQDKKDEEAIKLIKFNALVDKAYGFYLKGYNLSKSLKKAGIKSGGGTYFYELKKRLKANNVPIMLSNRKKIKNRDKVLSQKDKKKADADKKKADADKKKADKKEANKVKHLNKLKSELAVLEKKLEQLKPVKKTTRLCMVPDKPVKPIDTEENGRQKRMRFIGSRTSWYMKVMNMTRQKAMIMASDEWNSNQGYNRQNKNRQDKSQSKPKHLSFVVPSFPKIFGDNTKNGLLQDILRNMIANDTKMTSFNDGRILDVTSKEEWMGLLNILTRKSDEICKYFNVTGGKFKIVLNGNLQMLVYSKG